MADTAPQMGAYVGQKGVTPGFTIPDIQRVFPGILTTVFYRQPDTGDMNLIGYCTDISIAVASGAERIRHLSFFDAGRQLEQVLQPENYTLTLSGFTLFKSTFLGRVAGAGDVQNGAAQSSTFVGETATDAKAVNHILTPFNLKGLTPTIIDAKLWEKRTGQLLTPGLDAGTKVEATGYLYVYGDCYITNHTLPSSLRQTYVSETITAQPTWVAVEAYETT